MALLYINGYPALVWNNVLSLVQYLQGNVSAADTVAAETAMRAAVTTLINARDSLSAYQAATALARHYETLSSVTEIAIGLPDATVAVLAARVSAIQATEEACVALPATPLAVSTTIPLGNPSITDPGYIEFLAGYGYEAPPAGLTEAGFAATAASVAAMWSDTYDTLVASGTMFQNDALDQVASMRDASAVVAADVANITLSAGADLTAAWNRLVALPSILRAIAPLINDPTSGVAQDCMAARYVILTMINALTVAVTNLRSTPPTEVRLVVVRQNDTLMRIAARELGDFERFQEIAVLNSLQPPYIASTSSTGVTSPGQQIYVPTSTTTATTAVSTSNYRAPSYERSYLGVDVYYGPLDQDMVAWTGDLRTISGYDNLGFSLGRRIKTPLAAMIWHNSFGSRIPGEIGNVLTLTQATTGYLGAYAESAFMSDPRVASVTNLAVSADSATYGFSITADITPNGPDTTPTSITSVFANTGA